MENTSYTKNNESLSGWLILISIILALISGWYFRGSEPRLVDPYRLYIFYPALVITFPCLYVFFNLLKKKLKSHSKDISATELALALALFFSIVLSQNILYLVNSITTGTVNDEYIEVVSNSYTGGEPVLIVKLKDKQTRIAFPFYQQNISSNWPTGVKLKLHTATGLLGYPRIIKLELDEIP